MGQIASFLGQVRDKEWDKWPHWVPQYATAQDPVSYGIRPCVLSQFVFVLGHIEKDDDDGPELHTAPLAPLWEENNTL